MSDWTGVAGKQLVMTGATNGIGLAAAVELARRGARLAIVARDEAKGRESAERIRIAGANGGGDVEVLLADLSSQAQVRRLAGEVLERYPRVDVLINNAGAMFARRRTTEDGIELTWALNHLAPFLLTTLLLERLQESAPARVITTASDAHRGSHIPFDDLAAERSYNRGGFGRYGQTKLANILFTAELARRLQGTGVSAYCFHPGLVATGFNHNNGALMGTLMLLARPFSRSSEHGARTLVWLADSAEPEGHSGAYFTDEHVATPTAEGQDMDVARRLREVSEEQTRVPA
jgi:NAD(P)-dependent dehydrogenase (short-subunit alcohol dehydrogenase family)